MKTAMRMTRVAPAFSLIIIIGAIAAQAGSLTVPAGAQLHVVLETTLTTKSTHVGDPFRARLVIPVWADQKEILPVGTAVTGTVVGLKGAGRVSGRAEMRLRPETIYLPDGRDISLRAALESANTGGDEKLDPKEGTIQGGGKDGINAKRTVTGAAVGAGIGAVAAGGTGAAIGAGAVGAVALLHQVFKKGKDASLPAGTELVLEVTRPVSFSDMQEVPSVTQPKQSQKVPPQTGQ